MAAKPKSKAASVAEVESIVLDVFRVDDLGDTLEIFEAGGGRCIRVGKNDAVVLQRKAGEPYQKVRLAVGKYQYA